MFVLKPIIRFEERDLSGEQPIFLQAVEHTFDGIEFLIFILELKQAQPLNWAQASQVLHMVRNVRHKLSDEFKGVSFDDSKDLDELRFHVELSPAEILMDENPIVIKSKEDQERYKKIYHLITADLGRANQRLGGVAIHLAAQIKVAFDDIQVQSA
jgi:hypothetical protein